MEMRVGDTWQTLYGHDCYTIAEAENYIKVLGASSSIRIKGREAGEPSEQEKEWFQLREREEASKASIRNTLDNGTPEEKARMKFAIEAVIEALTKKLD